MSTLETLPIEVYKGHFIYNETDPWLITRGTKIRFSLGEWTGERGFSFHAASIEEARDHIDDMIAEDEIVNHVVDLSPSSPLSISGDTHKLQVLLFAVDDYRARLGRLVHEYPGIGKDVEMHRDIILEWQGIIATQIKDQKFDEETKD